MALKLMYITNSPEVAMIAEAAGVDRIFVDMEYIGKAARPGGMDTVQSHHTIQDIKNIKSAVSKSSVMVRVNPIHEASEEYCSSKDEIDAAIEAGADILMLPYFKTADEVRAFIKLVDGRVKTLPLVETPEAVEAIDEILPISGIDELYVGLNDLSLGYGRKFMFELLADGTVEKLSSRFKASGIPFGFGGIAYPGKGMLPSEYVIREHYRLGSACAILSRSFCNVSKVSDLNAVRSIFENGVREIRNLERECQRHAADSRYFSENKRIVARKVKKICEGK